MNKRLEEALMAKQEYEAKLAHASQRINELENFLGPGKGPMPKPPPPVLGMYAAAPAPPASAGNSWPCACSPMHGPWCRQATRAPVASLLRTRLSTTHRYRFLFH